MTLIQLKIMIPKLSVDTPTIKELILSMVYIISAIVVLKDSNEKTEAIIYKKRLLGPNPIFSCPI